MGTAIRLHLSQQRIQLRRIGSSVSGSNFLTSPFAANRSDQSAGLSAAIQKMLELPRHRTLSVGSCHGDQLHIFLGVSPEPLTGQTVISAYLLGEQSPLQIFSADNGCGTFLFCFLTISDRLLPHSMAEEQISRTYLTAVLCQTTDLRINVQNPIQNLTAFHAAHLTCAP